MVKAVLKVMLRNKYNFEKPNYKGFPILFYYFLIREVRSNYFSFNL
jgi:hypothetical protein